LVGDLDVATLPYSAASIVTTVFGVRT